jgi:hypothetical protein
VWASAGAEAQVYTWNDPNTGRLAEARAGLAGAEPWRGEERWQKLDAALRPRNNPSAK